MRQTSVYFAINLLSNDKFANGKYNVHVDAMQIMYWYTVESLCQLWDITSIDNWYCIYMTSNCTFPFANVSFNNRLIAKYTEIWCFFVMLISTWFSSYKEYSNFPSHWVKESDGSFHNKKKHLYQNKKRRRDIKPPKVCRTMLEWCLA